MCGAVGRLSELADDERGSSPRVRSGPGDPVPKGRPRGIISACAERSATVWKASFASGDHLRVCGAILTNEHLSVRDAGSSPRVRSDPHQRTPIRPRRGIISACAERSRRAIPIATSRGDHLRVCGAINPPKPGDQSEAGSSPRVRSDLVARGSRAARIGIISACAERSRLSRTCRMFNWDHLRVCGAIHTL